MAVINTPRYSIVDSNKFVARLNKALYGLVIAPERWYKYYTSVIESLGFENSPRELCVYEKHSPTNPALTQYILNYVDDILLTGSDVLGIQNTLHELKKHLDLKILGFPTRFVGIQIDRLPDGSIHLHQNNYIQRIVKSCHMDTVSSTPTPMIPIGNRKTHYNESQASFPYKAALGQVQFAVNYTRPDIAFCVGYLGRYASASQPVH